jgi:hypothetical protein
VVLVGAGCGGACFVLGLVVAIQRGAWREIESCGLPHPN